MGREGLGEVTDILGAARRGDERVGPELVRASNIVDPAGRSQSGDESLVELRLSAKPLKNFETLFVRQMEVKDYDRRERKPLAVGEGGIAS